MKHTLFLFASIAGLIMLLAACSEPIAPNTYQSAEGGFRITFPDTSWMVADEPHDLGTHNITIHAATVTTPGEDAANMLYRADYTALPWISTNTQIDSLFRAQWGYLHNIDQVHVLNIDTLEGRGYHAMQGLLGVQGGDVVTNYRMYFNQGTLYKLLVITGQEKHPNADAQQFFDSFVLL